MTVKKERNGTYTVVAYVHGKHIWRRGIETKRAALKIELELKNATEKSLERKTVDDLMSEFIAHQKAVFSKTTVKTNQSRYKTHIQPYIGRKILQKVTTKDVQEIVHILRNSNKNYSNVYINKIIEVTSNLFNYAVDMGYIERNPAKTVRKLKEPKPEIDFVTFEDFQKIYNALEDEPMHQKFLQVLFFTGIRLGECRALNWSQINFESNTICINAHVVDKGGKRRCQGRKNNKNYTVMMPNNVRESLIEIYRYESLKDDFSDERYVFGFYDSWSYNRIRRMYKKAIEKSNTKDYRIHDLRHGYASLLANSGASLQELAAALGDSLEVTISTYTHMYDNTNQKINDRVNRIIADSSFFYY